MRMIYLRGLRTFAVERPPADRDSAEGNWGAFSIETFTNARPLSYTHEDASGWLAHLGQHSDRNFWFTDANAQAWAYEDSGHGTMLGGGRAGGGGAGGSVRNVLIVGGGLTGHALGVLLRRAGIAVDLVEITADGNVSGSGINLQGNALRALREIGVWDRVRALGFGFSQTAHTAADGTVLHVHDNVRTGGPELPAALGIRRTDLHRVLSDAAREAGVRVRLGTTVADLADLGDAVAVRLTDGTQARYDLVVGADGIHSCVRELIGIKDEPKLTEIAVWRVQTRRPGAVTHLTIAHGGPCSAAGYVPTGEDAAYCFLVEPLRDRRAIASLDPVAEVRRLTAGYGGAWRDVHTGIGADTHVNYTPFHRLLVEGPWNRGRVVLAGDAAHVCPPTLAQGGAMSLEDALVLAELLTTRDILDQRLFDDYTARRLPRVRTVVDASVQLAERTLQPGPGADPAGLSRSTLTALAERP